MVKKLQELQAQSLGQEDPLEKEMATHSSILAWEIPWTEETIEHAHPPTHTHTHCISSVQSFSRVRFLVTP